MARDLGRGEAEKAFPTSTHKYVRDEAVTLQGWDGYALDIQDAAGAGVMMRTYIVRDRLYRLLVTHKGDMKTRSASKVESGRRRVRKIAILIFCIVGGEETCEQDDSVQCDHEHREQLHAGFTSHRDRRCEYADRKPSAGDRRRSFPLVETKRRR